MKTLEGFKESMEGIKKSFEWAIEKKKEQNEDIEMEEKCLEKCNIVLKYIQMYERDFIG